MDCTIRKARVEDLPQCAQALYESGPSLYSYIFVLKHPQILSFLEMLLRNRGLYSVDHVLVAEVEGKVIGMCLAYKGERVKQLAKAMANELPRMFKELGMAGMIRMMVRGLGLNKYLPKILEDEYFLSNLAVDSSFQGRSIGRTVMAAYESKAREESCTYCSLFVETDNLKALSFYTSLGYREVFHIDLPQSYRKFGLRGFKKMLKTL